MFFIDRKKALFKGSDLAKKGKTEVRNGKREGKSVATGKRKMPT